MRTIINIEVLDDKFKEFVRQFDAYQDNLKAQGTLWNKQGQAIKGANAQLKSLASLADELSERISAANKNQEKLRESTDKSSRAMSGLARNTRDVAKSILSATTMLLKWSGITTAIGGLLGAGGLFGMNRLASNISGQQKNATGLGITYGAGRAFGPAFNRFLDNPQGLLQKMAEYKSSAAGMAEFAKMGISGHENKTADELAIEVMQKAGEFYRKTPKNLLANYADAYGFSGVLSLEEMRRLGARGDLEERIGVFGSEKKRLNLLGGTTDPYQDFSDQRALSGAAIEATFGKALSALTPQLTRLSEAFRKAVDVFMRSDLVKGAIDGLTKGLGTLAAYLSSPQFLNDMDEFLENMQKLAMGLKKIIGSIPGIDMSPDPAGVMRRTERSYGLKPGTLKRIAEAATPAGFELGAAFYGNLGFFSAIAKNPKSLSPDAIKSQINAIIKNDIGRTDPSQYREGTALYWDAVRRQRAADEATNRALIELKVINETGGNAAVSINGMVAQ